MTAASLDRRLRKLQNPGDGRSLADWGALFRQDPDLCPDWVLVSLCVGRLIPEPLAGAVFDHPLREAWLESGLSTELNFGDWLVTQGTSIDRILDEVRKRPA